MLDCSKSVPSSCTDSSIDCHTRHENAEKLRSLASNNIKTAQVKYKARYDEKHDISIKLKAGQSVLLENSRDKSRKGGRLNDRFKVR